MNVNNSKLGGNSEIVEVVNDYFCEIKNQLSSKLKHKTKERIKLLKINDKTCFINYTDRPEIKPIILNMKDKSGGG